MSRSLRSFGPTSFAALISAAVFTLACKSASSAPDAGIADLSAALEPFRADGGMPAIAAAVYRGGALVAIGASGARKLGDPTQATTSDLWHLGSDTKAMTATLIAIYVDRGQIHFEDTLATLYAGQTIDPGWNAVTLEMLLQHRGGAPADVPPATWNEMWAAGADPAERRKAVLETLAQPPAQAPGTFVYANTGYMIAGYALERAVGSSWDSLIRTQLWSPLGMSSCGFGAPGTPHALDQPWGHTTNADGSLTPMDPGTAGSDNPPSLGPAGTVHCSLADWGRFLALHLAGARGEAIPASLLSAATIQRLQTPPASGDYADGWLVAPRSWAGAAPALTHTGSNTLWYATAWLAPSKNLAMMVATNCASPPAQVDIDRAFGPLINAYAQ